MRSLLPTALLATLALAGQVEPLDAQRNETPSTIQELEGAVAAAESALRRGESQLAASHYRDALREGLSILGALSLVDGDAESAEDFYRSAGTVSVELRLPTLNLARALVRQGKVDEAVAELRRLASRDALDVETRRLLARVLLDAGRADEAIPELEDARRAAPDDPELGFALATAMLELSRPERAKELLEEVGAARPVAATWVLIGRTYRDFEQFDEARAALDRALTMDPGARRAHYYLGTIDLLEEGRALLDRAAQHFERELELAPDDLPTLLYLGMTRVEARQFDQAEEPLSRVAAADEPPADALHYLGRCYLGLERAGEAVSALRRALNLATQGRRDPKPRQLRSIHYQLALALRADGQNEEASGHFEQAQTIARNLTEQDREYLERYLSDSLASARRSNSFQAGLEAQLAELTNEERQAIRNSVSEQLGRSYLNLGILRVQSRQFDRAVPYLEQARAHAPELPGLLRTLGITLFNASDFPNATEALKAARKQDPNDGVVRRMLALSALETGEPALTASLLEPDAGRASDPSLQYAFALALVRSQQPAAAQRVFDQLEKQHGDWAPLQVLVGHAHGQDGNWPEAIAAFERALEIEGGVAQAHSSLGMIYLQQGQLPKAAHHFRSELERRPTDHESTYHLATVLELQESYDEAEALLRDLLRKAPRFADGLYLLGKVLMERAAFAAAVEPLERAVELAPDSPTYRYQLGLALQRAGEPERARQEFETFQKLKKESGGPS